MEQFVEFDVNDPELRARHRHKYWLLNKWRIALEDYEGRGESVLVDNYRPQGLVAPIEVEEIAGLIILDTNGQAHHFRLYRDETAAFIESPEDARTRITIDPVSIPIKDEVYDSDGVPDVVLSVFDAMDLTGPWEHACPDGSHELEFVNPDSPYEFVACERCDLSRNTLTWMGHDIPRPIREDETDEYQDTRRQT